MNKQAMVNALQAFISQPSGIEWGNYQCGDWKQTRECFMGDYRPILRHGKHARQMLQYVELSDITADELKEASRAYSGRLQFVEKDGKVGCDYTTGQYFPTELPKRGLRGPGNGDLVSLATRLQDWRGNPEASTPPIRSSHRSNLVQLNMIHFRATGFCTPARSPSVSRSGPRSASLSIGSACPFN